MMTVAYDINGKRYYAANFKSSAEAHSRKYFDDCGIPVTPVVSDSKTPHFRYYTQQYSGGHGDGVSEIHQIAQNRVCYIFKDKKLKFYVKYWNTKNGDCKGCSFDLKEYYQNPCSEKKIGRRCADILLEPKTDNYPPILIEISYTHDCVQSKIDEGYLIIEVRVKDLEDVHDLIRNWGLKESLIRKKRPKVRFFNFRNYQGILPWEI